MLYLDINAKFHIQKLNEIRSQAHERIKSYDNDNIGWIQQM